MKNSAVASMMALQHQVPIEDVRVVSIGSQFIEGAYEYEFEVQVTKECYENGFENHTVKISSKVKD